MAEKQSAGMLASAEVRDLVSRGEIDTVWVVTPDLFGRPIGKSLGGRFFVDEVMDREVQLAASQLLRGYDGAPVALPDAARIGPNESLTLRPDGATMRRATWRERSVVAICDIVERRGGDSHPLSTRGALRRQLERARSASVSPRASATLGFQTSKEGSGAEMVAALRRNLEASAIPLEHLSPTSKSGHFEVAPCQAGFLESADRLMLLKCAAKEVAAAHGDDVSFMAQADESVPASGLEVHSSLRASDREAPLFVAAEAEPSVSAASSGGSGLSNACRWWLGGVLQHARDLTLIFAPTVNSYRRYRSDPRSSLIAWGRDHLGVGARVNDDVGPGLGVISSFAGADANPYLVLTGTLAAGLDGLAHRIDPPTMVERGAVARALPHLSLTLVESAEIASKSTFLRQILGDQMILCLAAHARHENESFERIVTWWEKNRYGASV